MSSARAVVTSWAVWNPEGVWLKGARIADGRWADAPSLARIHPRARRPPPEAEAWVQLGHLLLSGRPSVAEGQPLHRLELDLLIGTVAGSAAADHAFEQGLSDRGSGFGSPSTFVYTLSTAAPAEAALALGLRGGLFSVTAGSASGLTSVVRAMARIEGGHTRACLGGGSEPGRLALFLLESEAAAPPGVPRLFEGRAGWSPGEAGAPSGGPDPLLALARSLGPSSVPAPTSRPSEYALRHVSADGHWASLRVKC